VLKSAPKNANALFNLGMIRRQDNNDASGTIATWQELLRRNQNLDGKSTVLNYW
jgi:cytochrome c-type biogenesis protein CcmH/NrfG